MSTQSHLNLLDVPRVTPETLLQHVEFFRADATRKLDPARRSELGQFLTPLPVSRLMAGMFQDRPESLRILDAGAGVGALCAALVAAACDWEKPPKEISITAYEVEPILIDYLLTTLEECAAVCHRAGIKFIGEVRKEDFIEGGVATLQGHELFPGDRPNVNAAILNPPYRKINSDSRARQLLSTVGIEATTLDAYSWGWRTRMPRAGERELRTALLACSVTASAGVSVRSETNTPSRVHASRLCEDFIKCQFDV